MVLAQLMRNEGIKTKLYVYSIQFLGQLNTFQLKAYISCSLYNLEQAKALKLIINLLFEFLLKFVFRKICQAIVAALVVGFHVLKGVPEYLQAPIFPQGVLDIFGQHLVDCVIYFPLLDEAIMLNENFLYSFFILFVNYLF